jgi:predicted dinucleotide-binding enzyme
MTAEPGTRSVTRYIRSHHEETAMNSYTIGIVGGGGMGAGITRGLTAAGHTVLVTDSKPGTAATVAAEASAGQPGQARAASAEDAVSAGIVVLALWYPGTGDFAATYRAALADSGDAGEQLVVVDPDDSDVGERGQIGDVQRPLVKQLLEHRAPGCPGPAGPARAT